jgi:hypothetical protein
VARLRATHRSGSRLSRAQVGLTDPTGVAPRRAARWHPHPGLLSGLRVLWKTLAASCRQAGLGDEPRQVFEELSEIALVDVVLPTRNGVEVRKRCISQPTEHQRILRQRLGMRLPTVLDRTQM